MDLESRDNRLLLGMLELLSGRASSFWCITIFGSIALFAIILEDRVGIGDTARISSTLERSAFPNTVDGGGTILPSSLSLYIVLKENTEPASLKLYKLGVASLNCMKVAVEL